MLKTPALVIKKQNLGETDRILTIISPVLGKKRVIAKAVRRPLSKLAGHLDTLMLSQIMLTDEDDLPKVAGAVLVEPFNQIRNSLELLDRAYAVSRLIERVIIEDVADRPIFQLAIDCLTRLNSGQKWSNAWLYFLAKLTNRLGLGITDFSCGSCHQPLTSSAWWLAGDHKFICATCVSSGEKVRLDPNSLKLLRLLSLETFDLIDRINIPAPAGGQTEEIYLRLITEWLNKPWTNYSSLQIPSPKS